MVQRASLFLITCLTSVSLIGSGSLRAESEPSKQVGTGQPLAGADLLAQAAPSAEPSAIIEAASPILLAPGAQSSDVVVLQRQLRQLGHYSGPLDGAYGKGTAKAVEAFQRSAGLPVTGSLDQQTWTQMQIPQLLADQDSPAGGSPSDRNQPASSQPDADQTAGDRTAAASAPDPAADPSEGSADDAPAEAESAAPPARAGRFSRLASLGLLMLLSSAVLLAVFSWNRRRGLAPAAELPEQDYGLDRPAGLDQPDSVRSYDLDLASPLAVPAVEVAEAAGASVGLSHHPEGSVNGTTRLARVNISDELVEDLRSPDATKRHKAIWELGQRGSGAAVPALVDIMVDADSQERSLILAALSEIGMRTLKPMNRALALSLQDENPEVRKNAIRDLTRVYDLVGQLSQMLGHAAQDHDVEVQETAQWALEQLGRIRQLPGSPYPLIKEAPGSVTSLPEDTSRSRP
jgi:peptidoglycan hydrolase-like protein with peptidoglycan-binding domain